MMTEDNKIFENQFRAGFDWGNIPSFAGQDMEKMLDYWYGGDLDSDLTDVEKATVATTTTGYVVDTSSPTVWIWAANQPVEVAAWTILPKITYDTNAWIVETAEADATTAGVNKDTGNLPTDTVPTLARAASGVKVIPTSTSVSMAAMIEGRAGNAPEGDILPYLKISKGQNFARSLDKHLLTDPDTLASNNLESLLRVAGSKAEEDSSDVDAGDLDIYGFDRSSATTYDSYVNRNSGASANLTLTMIDTAFENIRPKGNPKVILTGLDTLRRLSTLLQSQEIYTTKNVTFDFNGMSTLSGVNAGFEVATYNGVPMIADTNMPSQGTLSEMLFLDTDYLALQTAVPITYQETSDIFINNGFKTRGVWLYVGELQATRFNAQAKITWLK